MSEEIKASVQYGDMRGTIAIDGWDGLTTVALGGRHAKGYWPVGIELYLEPLNRGGALAPTVYVLAVDESILDGRGPDAVRKYARENGELPVFRFRTELTFAKLIPFIKRLSIVLQDRSTERVPLMRVAEDALRR